MLLSHDLVLVYVLQSGCVGCLTSGSVLRHGARGLNVYDSYGRVIEYLSGKTSHVRSWRLAGPTGNPIQGWHSVSIEDLAKLLPAPSFLG